MSRNLFIHASNIHQGGGRSLLKALFSNLPANMGLYLTLDKRLSLPDDMLAGSEIRRVEPSVFSRFKAEKWLADHVAADDLVLCLSSLPPLFKLKGHVVVFVQNRYLVDPVKLSGFSLRSRMRIMAERFWLSLRLSNVSEFVVQTPAMKRLMKQFTGGKIKTRVVPFLDCIDGYRRSISFSDLPAASKPRFLYVASGDPHKNHRLLICAWCLLAKEGLFPSLRLTIDSWQFPELCTWISRQSEQNNLDVENMGSLDHGEVKKLYGSADALIYPSTMESFGIPLIEARQAGLSVLASELDYVRDVLDPDQSFDPLSEVSIARAVKRFLGLDESVLPLVGAKEFFTHIFKNES